MNALPERKYVETTAGKYFFVTLRSQGKAHIRVMGSLSSIIRDIVKDFPYQFLIVRIKCDSRWRHRSQEFLQLRHLLRSPAGKNDGFARLTFDFYSITIFFFTGQGNRLKGFI